MKHFRATPTLLYLVTLFAGLVAMFYFPMKVSSEILSKELVFYAGVLLLFVTFVINLMAYNAFKKHHTPYAPYSVPKVLIQQGIFRYSRNPVYLALVLSQLSFGLITDILWLVISASFLWVILDRTVIKNEERLLLTCFKENYTLYKKQTRRWI